MVETEPVWDFLKSRVEFESIFRSQKKTVQYGLKNAYCHPAPTR